LSSTQREPFCASASISAPKSGAALVGQSQTSVTTTADIVHQLFVYEPNREA
jgi:hypothetical protein